ncbi:MAG: DHHA1 domain-containing protein [Peptostreptococcus sp.]|uniref:alanyl-tRNA editing protein n=1 Tax=Peptostreptococcus sp. TaxID=1262 RepID=UPI002FC805DA
MENLYYRERNLKEVKTQIKKVIDYNGKTGILLKENIFFPGGGGQISDSGYITGVDKNNNEIKVKVINVLEDLKFGIVVLIENIGEIDIDAPVKCTVDWDRREDGMQQHTGQHVLSGCFFKIFQRNTKGLHIGKELSQLDIEGEFTDDMVKEIEEYANNIIQEGIDIKNYIIDDELRKKNITRRPLPDTKEEIRVLEIPNLDINACCGVHCYNTRDLRMIKIKRFYRHKGSTRFEYLVGQRAVKYVLERENVFERVLNNFNCDEKNIENAIHNLNNKKDELYEKNRYSSLKYIELFSNEIINSSKINKDNIYIVYKIFEGEKNWLLADIAKYITENYKAIVLFANKADGFVDIKLQASKKLTKEHKYINLGEDFKNKSKLVDAKGGGSAFMAQGMCENQKNIDNFLDSIYHIYIEK